MLRASIRSLHRITATCISTSPPRVDASPPSQGPQISSEMQIMVRSASLPANCFNLCRGWMRTNSRQTKLTADLRNWLFLPLVLSLHPYSNSAKKKKDFNAKQRTLQNVTHCSKILRLARIRILKLVLDKDFVLAFSEGQVLQNYNITCKILIARLWAILFQRPYLYVSAQKVLISLSWQSGLRWGCVISLGWGCVIPQRWGFVIFPEALGLTPTQVLEIGCVILELKYFRICFCNSLRKSKNSIRIQRSCEKGTILLCPRDTPQTSVIGPRSKAFCFLKVKVNMTLGEIWATLGGIPKKLIFLRAAESIKGAQ